MRIAIFGSTGFVGSAIASCVRDKGHRVLALRTPRLDPIHERAACNYVEEHADEVAQLSSRIAGSDAVINAAGNPNASERDQDALRAANGVVPGLVAKAVNESGVRRFVHVSSAVVQGRLPQLDETSEYDAFSDYAQSKVLGEQLAHKYFAPAVVYRPPSVHGVDRRVTRSISRLGKTGLLPVAAPSSSPTPQALIHNVSDAISTLALSLDDPPPVVIHPWEGLTTSEVIEILGGRRPRVVPRGAARLVVRGSEVLGRGIPAVAANARRLEMLMFGQQQASSYLTRSGWVPPFGADSWMKLGHDVRALTNSK